MEPEEVVSRAVGRQQPRRPPTSPADVRSILKSTRPTTFAALLKDEFRDKTLWQSLARDSDTVRMVIPAIASRKGLEVDKNLLLQAEFRMSNFDGGITGWSSVALDKIATGPWADRLTWGDVFADIDNYRMDLYLSQSQATDLVVNQYTLDFATRRVDLALKRAGHNAERISAFNDLVFAQAHPLSTAFNSGTVSLSEALQLLDRAQRFKEWIGGKAADSDIAQEYFAAVSKAGFLDRFPGKPLRFALTASAGAGISLALNPAAGIAAGVALQAFDTFVVSRFANGWRPSMFIAEAHRRLGSRPL